MIAPRVPAVGPLWSLPNLLSLSRLPLGLALWAAPASPWWVVGVVLVAELTDVLDGVAARRLAQAQGPGGAWLDPLCDKLFMLNLLIVACVVGQAPAWVGFAMAGRECLQAPLSLLYALSPRLRQRVRFDFRAAWPGRLVTALQFATCAAIWMDHPWRDAAAVVTGVGGVGTALGYLARSLGTVKVR